LTNTGFIKDYTDKNKNDFNLAVANIK